MKKVIFALALFCSVNLFAQSAGDAVSLLDTQYGFGAKSIAMGTAYTAVADDYSATYWNPAGLAQIKKMEFFIGLSNLSIDNDATYKNTLTNYNDSFTKFNSFGLVFPVPTYRGSLVFSLGYQRVKDFESVLRFEGFNQNENEAPPFYIDSTDYYFDRNLQQEELVKQDGSLNNWSIAGAIDISPNVSVGATLNFWTGSSTYLFDLYQFDPPYQGNENGYYPVASDPNRNLDFYSYGLSQKVLSEYSSFQLKLGTLLKPSDILSFGLNIGLPYSMNVVEKYNENDIIIYDDGYEDPIEYEPGEYEYDVSLPFQFGFGAAFSDFGLTASLDLEYIDVSQVEFDIPDDAALNADNSSLLDENKIIDDNYDSKLKIKLGAEYLWEEQNLAFRGGYMSDPSPLKEATSDYDRQFLSGGIGIIVDKQVLLDLAYLYGTWKKFSSDEYTPDGTEEDITYQKIYLTASFRF